MNIEQDAKIICPYCSSEFTLLIDISGGEQTLVEDCEVCCQPVVLSLHIDNGTLVSCDARREND